MDPSRLLFVAFLAILSIVHSVPDGKPVDQSKCDQTPLQIVFLFDLSPRNNTDFSRQQSRVIETIRHIDALTHERSVSFGFVVFHRLPVLLSPLNSPKSSDSSKVTEQVQAVRPRRHASTSPAKALDLAADQFEKNGKQGARSIVFLVHDGSNSDLIAETLEAVERLQGQKVDVFAISGSRNPDIFALVGYTLRREKIYSDEKDRINFFATVDTVIGLCGDSKDQILPEVSDNLDGFEKKQNPKFSASMECPATGQVDMVVVLDTSGSVFRAFAEERELASELIRQIDPEKFEKNMQIGLVSFASKPLVLLPLSRGRTPSTVINRIQNVEFTGMNTRISDAVELVLEELESRRRVNALQMVVLITDGHGQEFWNQAQTAGKKLQKSNSEVFLATTLPDFNYPEMLLYAGDDSRIFVGKNFSNFLPTVRKLINRCVGSENYVPPVTVTKKFNESSIVKLNFKNNQKIGQNIFAEEKIQKSVIKAVDEKKSESQEVLSISEREEARQKADRLRGFLSQQRGLPKSADCDTDLIFVIERSQKSTFNFSDQLELISKVIEGVMPVDVESGKVRFGLVTFSKKSKIIVSLNSGFNIGNFTEKIRNILPFHSSSDLDEGLETALEEINEKRRKKARVVVVLVTSGKLVNIDLKKFEKIATNIKKIENSDIFAVSLNPFNDAKVLTKLTGDRWRVFVDARVRQFSRDIGNSLSSCSLAAREIHKDADSHEPDSSVEKVEHLALFAKKLEESDSDCGTDPIDLVLILDISTSITREFDEQKRISMDLLKQAPLGDIGSRIKVGITTFNQFGKTVVSLNNSLEREELLFSLDRIEHTGGQTSVVAGISQSISDISQFRRIGARLVVVLISDGNSRDSWSRVQKAGNTLRKSGADVFAIALSKERNEEELTVYTNSKKRVFSDDKTSLFILSSKKIIFGCSIHQREKQLADIAVAGQEEAEIEHVENLDKVAILKPTDDPESSEKDKKPKSEVGNKGKVEILNPTDDPESSEKNEEGEVKKEEDKTEISKSKTVPESLEKDEIKEISNDTDEEIKEKDKAEISKSKTVSESLKKDEIKEVSNDTDEETKKEIKEKDKKEISKSKTAPESLKKDEIKEVSNDTDEETKEEIKEEDKKEISKSKTAPESFMNEQGREMFKMETTEEPEKHIQTLFSDDCTVDLMFIIDTSQSVADEFQKQLQFAVDLVKRLPDDDFETRVNVAAVSFYKTSKIEFPFGKFKEKSKVLDALLKIEHTGGSTSAVSGVELAVEEIIRSRRSGARLMVVLVSDGNSQDLWENVVSAAEKLRSINADVYAVTVSHDYFFRELELYAGNKWFVYIDARIRQFLDEAEMSVVECRNPSVPANHLQSAKIGPPTKLEDIATTLASISVSSTPFPTPSPVLTGCQQDIVDLMIVLDTSTSVEKEFYAEKNFALDLIKVLPEADFSNRIRVALVKFNSEAQVQFNFGEKKSRNDILYEIERVEHTGGQTSLVAGVSLALDQISSKKRPNSRLVTIIISDGNSQDEWSVVQITSKKLIKTGSEIYAVTLSEKYYFDELKEYTGNERHVYIDEKIQEFIQDVGLSVVSCPGRFVDRVTLAPNVEISVTPMTPGSSPITRPTNPKLDKSTDFAMGSSLPEFALAKDDFGEISVIERGDSVITTSNGRCKYSKMDLIVILDASTSRQEVFEHQRELALSLVERLPIARDDTHVAIGLNSFTSVPTLRQTLGLGRDKLMVRKAIEDIKYRGGSTLTSKAVELAVKDLERGRRPDALQVVVLMNDGMSQDPWEKVLLASERLKETGAERFGVALGDDVDLRELRHYIENENRIYRDGSTEKFLSDVVDLLNGGEIDCQQKPEVIDEGFPQASVEDCLKPKLDVVVVFDATDNTPNQDDPKITSNKYLLLDVLGSLPANDDVKVSITSFGPEPKLDHKFSDPQDRDSVFERIQSIQPVKGTASYSRAVHSALDYYNQNKRSDARGLLLIVGDGNSADEKVEKSLTANLVKKIKGIECHAVDSGKEIDEMELATYTGDVKRVYNYDRNADFAKELLRLATLGQSEHCVETRKQEQPSESVRKEEVYSTAAPFLAQDIVTEDKADKDVGNVGDKIITIERKTTLRPKITTVKEPTSTTEASTTTKKAKNSKSPTSKILETSSTSKPSLSPKSTQAPSETVESDSGDDSKPKPQSDSELKPKPKSKTNSEPELKPKPDSDSKPKPKPKSQTDSKPKPKPKSQTDSKPKPKPKSQTDSKPKPKPQSEPLANLVPGCLIDLILIIDASGSVEETFNREKELAAGIIDKLRIGPDNARISLIKFASKNKIKTYLTFDGLQSKKHVLKQLHRISFSSGTTAIHMALLQAITEYSIARGARPGKATPIVVIFTDGFTQKDTSKESALLREAIPDVFAIAINHEYPISRVELETITGDSRRVFTDSNIKDFHQLLAEKLKSC